MNRIGKGVRILAFFAALFFAVLLLNDTMIPKRGDGITPMKAYYAQKPDTVDVLVIGSSHAGMNLSVQTLWDEYGIASFILWGSVQPFWNSYYNLVEAFKTQTPKVVVLEAYAATFSFEYSDEARQVANVEGMRFSVNKLKAIRATAPKERWADLIASIPLVHDRYDELTKTDFDFYPWSNLLQNKGGSEIRYSIGNALPDESAAGITEVRPLYPKEEEYLQKIVNLCKEKNVPLLLFSTPVSVAARPLEQPYYNRVAEIAAENGISYINCNLLDQEIQFDCTRDYASDDTHLNTMGARKITRYLGNYLKETYDLPDRRGEPGFESWEDCSKDTERQYIPQITDARDYLAELSAQGYLYYIIKNSSWEMTDGYRYLEEQFARMGIGQNVMEVGGGVWTLDASVAGAEPISRFDGNMMCQCTVSGVDFSTDFANSSEVKVNGEVIYHLHGPGIILVVYDVDMQKCIDITDYLVANGFALARP